MTRQAIPNSPVFYGETVAFEGHRDNKRRQHLMASMANSLTKIKQPRQSFLPFRVRIDRVDYTIRGYFKRGTDVLTDIDIEYTGQHQVQHMAKSKRRADGTFAFMDIECLDIPVTEKITYALMNAAKQHQQAALSN